MTRIGLLSDTHAYWDEKYLEYFEPCDEIWHAGDIGSLEVAEKLAAFRPFRAVYGNIDGQEIRKLYPQINRFTVDGAEVLIKHIGGYPGKYDPSIIGSLMTRPPKLFISGHSHILKVKYDKTLDMLHINPGAAGMSGFHNWIPTTDNRLLRRIIRDFNYRGYSARETISRWPSVRAGEDKWIFPYQENADVMFNSALLFEFAVLRLHAEPILMGVPRNCPEYCEAYRLLKFIKYFVPVQDKEIPPTSLLREFLGGSSFKY